MRILASEQVIAFSTEVYRRKLYSQFANQSMLPLLGIDMNSDMPRFKHTWSQQAKGKLDSSCLRCHTVIATAKDEMTLLVMEHRHRCDSRPATNDTGDQSIAPQTNSPLA